MSVFPTREKSEVFKLFKNYVYNYGKFLNCWVKAIRSDNGTEIMTNNFKSFCEQRGIRHEFTNIYTPE